MNTPKSACWMKRLFLLALLSSLITIHAQTIPSAPVSANQIEVGQSIERRIKGGESHLYQLPLAAGECATLEMAAGEANVFWEAWIEKDNILVSGDPQKSPRLWLVAERATTWFLKITPFSSQAPARRYRFRVAEQRPATESDHTRFQAAVSHEQAANLYGRDDTDSLRQAVEHCRAAATLWQSVGEVMNTASAYNLMGLSLLRLDEITDALAAFEQALTRFRALRFRDKEINLLNNMAALLLRAGEAQQAINCYGAIPYSQSEAEYPLHVGRAHMYIANAYRLLGDLTKARAFHESGLTLIQRERGPDFYQQLFEAQALYELGWTCGLLGDYPQAFAYLNQALEVAHSHPLIDRAESGRIRQVMGEIHFSRGEYGRAQELYRQALTTFQQFGGTFHQAQIRNYLGATALKLEDTNAAREWYSQALAQGATIQNVLIESTARVGLARIERLQGNLSAALQHIEQGLRLIESQRRKIVAPDLRATFLATKREAYEFHLDLLAQSGEQENSAARRAAAFAASERSRARSLLEIISANAGQLLETTDPQLAARDHELRQKISLKADEQTRLTGKAVTPEQQARLNQELTLLLAEHDRLAMQLRQRDPRYAGLAKAQPLTLQEIQQQVLDDNTLLLEYALGNERSWLFAVTRTELYSFALPPRRELEQAARALFQSLEAHATPPTFRSLTEAQRWRAQQQQNMQPIAQQLSRMLLTPVRDLMPGRRLLIVPDGALHYVPFAALPECGIPVQRNSRKTQHSAFRTPLIVNHEIVTLPSASTLAAQRSEWRGRAAAPKTLSIFADPVFGANDERFAASGSGLRTRKEAGQAGLPRLLFSRQEGESLAALVAEPQRKLALDFAAQRTAALSEDLRQYRYVHFATHGLLDNKHAELSALALSLVDQQGAAQDGYLRTMDIFKLNLNAELVVLSGCQTALGKEVNGEGLLGLTRGFMHAGARRVVASLWQVNDAATAELMRWFYQGMLGERKLSPAAALRAAQLEMWQSKRWSAPYYWAAFVLQGEW
jgi:CHAT domain-containing protein